jgi:hypothetical protein
MVFNFDPEVIGPKVPVTWYMYTLTPTLSLLNTIFISGKA